MAVIGIDLGTTYSAAAIRREGEPPEIIFLEGESTMPSVVGLQRNGKIAVGRTAKRNQARYPQDTVVEVKRKMGTEEVVNLGQQPFTPQELSAKILSKIKELAEAELGEAVTGVVISCPAYFKDPARQATKQAGEIAGLKVLKIINEPTAAAYAYGVNQGNDDENQLYLIYDLGGGTFDVTVIKMMAGSIEVIGTGGDPTLGGGNFDDCIVEWMFERLGETHPEFMATLNDEKRHALSMRLKSYAETAKKALCNSSDEEPIYHFKNSQVAQHLGKPIVFNETLTLAEFERRIEDLVANSFTWVDKALKIPKEEHHHAESDITAILMVGGSTRVPLVWRKVAERFPDTPLRGEEEGVHPDEIVALGAGIVASDLDPESDEVGGTFLVDVTGHTLSVAVFSEQLQREQLEPIVAKDTPIPCDNSHGFQSRGRFQEQCRVRVFQGEGREINLEHVKMIGEFFIAIPPREEPIGLHIGLNIDDNGLLLAHAKEDATGQKAECKINYEDSAQLSPAEIEQKRLQHQAQMNAVIGQTANPLDGTPLQQPPAAQAYPPPQPGQPTQPGPPPAAQPVNQTPADPTTLMNPIMRNLYNKAINEFHRVPAERQGELMQIVQQIDNAARAGDRQMVEGLAPRLSQLLDGV